MWMDAKITIFYCYANAFVCLKGLQSLSFLEIDAVGTYHDISFRFCDNKTLDLHYYLIINKFNLISHFDKDQQHVLSILQTFILNI